jgi:uncharacterized membrane protein YozB (DUF420 family)
MKLKKAEYGFIFFYLNLLMFLIIIIQVILLIQKCSLQQETFPLWAAILWLCLFSIGALLIYLLIQQYLYRKMMEEQQ